MGWKPVGFSEIEKFPSEVLKHHYPEVPNFGDMTKFKDWNINDTVGLLVGGTPCQSFSVAGLRKGLEDPRGNLALTYCAILDRFRPKWFIWENVPGVLSSSGGRDFGSFLGAVSELGYGFAYRVLDAQHFGVAQRRRRVFVVGHIGGWQAPAEVLFESESLSGNTEPSKQSWQETSNNVRKSITASGKQKFGTLMANAGSKQWLGNQEEFTGDYHILQKQVYENHGTDCRIKPVTISPTVTARWGTGGNNVPLAHAFKIRGGCEGGGKGYLGQDEKAFTLSTLQDQQIFEQMAIRRLTPVECERLQGFPDNYTNIKQKCPDSPRYKAMGNSMAVPVMRWIGERINGYEQRGMEA
jgi:DNA (cytosine-5)-methyltransferase 1